MWAGFDEGGWLAAPMTPRVEAALERLWPGHGAVFEVAGADAAAARALCVGDWDTVDRAIDGDWQAASDRTPDLWEDLSARWVPAEL